MALKILINEAILLKAISLGDEKAFAKIFHAYHHQLGDFIYSITHSKELTEELVHDIFLKIWHEREKLVAVQKFNSYLFILTRNYTLNAIRKLANLKKKSLTIDEFLVQKEDAEEIEKQEYQYSLVENAIAQLPPRQQQVFLLKREGFKNAEIASQMDLSPNSVKKYHQWSMQTITKFIKNKAALVLAFSFFNIFF